MINNYLLFYKRAFIIETKRWWHGRERGRPAVQPAGLRLPGGGPPAQYLAWARQGNTGALLGLLYRQRKAAMEELHGAQRRVDILDYMIRSLREPERRQ